MLQYFDNFKKFLKKLLTIVLVTTGNVTRGA